MSDNLDEMLETAIKRITDTEVSALEVSADYARVSLLLLVSMTVRAELEDHTFDILDTARRVSDAFRTNIIDEHIKYLKAVQRMEITT